MLLQLSKTATLDSLSLTNGSAANLMVYIIVGFITCGLIIYFVIRERLVKSKKRHHGQTGILNGSEIPIIQSKCIIPKKDIEAEKEIKGGLINSNEIKNTVDHKPVEKLLVVDIHKADLIKPSKEEQSKVKYIGYNPINIFAQSEPLSFPYVIMPAANCVIKFPRKGRVGRKGYTEENFKTYLDKYFKNAFQVLDDRFIIIKNNLNPFEPDFTLTDEKNGINIFLDIEIDEPYEGINDLNERRPTHFQYSDINRNNAFKNRGWIVIRFAEIQVHQEPDSCCRFLADLIKSIHPEFTIPSRLNNVKQISLVKQWTKEEAVVWSLEKYREKYLGIKFFGATLENQALDGVAETDLGEKIEEMVVEEKPFIPPSTQNSSNSKIDLINSALQSNRYLSFSYQGFSTIVKPILTEDVNLIAFCYVKNRDRVFNIYEISNLQIKNSYFTLRVAGPTIGLDKITNAINTGIYYDKHIRMKYTRSAWTNMFVDQETGELLQDRIEAEESVRTINNIQLAINALAQEHIASYNLDSNHITAYCNKREEQRTFRFDRIGEIEILDI